MQMLGSAFSVRFYEAKTKAYAPLNEFKHCHGQLD